MSCGTSRWSVGSCGRSPRPPLPEDDPAVLAAACDGLRRLSERRGLVWEVLDGGDGGARSFCAGMRAALKVDYHMTCHCLLQEVRRGISLAKGCVDVGFGQAARSACFEHSPEQGALEARGSDLGVSIPCVWLRPWVGSRGSRACCQPASRAIATRHGPSPSLLPPSSHGLSTNLRDFVGHREANLPGASKFGVVLSRLESSANMTYAVTLRSSRRRVEEGRVGPAVRCVQARDGGLGRHQGGARVVVVVAHGFLAWPVRGSLFA